MEIVLMYKDNGKDYIVYKQDGKFFGCINHDGEFDYNLSREERKTLDHIFKELCFNSNSERIATIKFQSELTDIYYDKEKDLYNFKFQSGKELTKEQLSALNRLYNNRDDVVYFNFKESDYIKRIVKKGKKSILVLLSASMILQTGMVVEAQASYDNSNEIEETEIFDLDDYIPKKSTLETKSYEMSDKEKQERINTLREALRSNPNLNDEEKAYLFNNCFQAIIDNIEYLNYDYLQEIYKGMDIKYDADLGLSDAGFNIAGTYKIANGLISLAPGYTELDKYNSILDHEFLHSLQGPNPCWSINYVYEALNSIYTSEYNGTKVCDDNYVNYDSNAYDIYKPYIYVLAEIIRPETLKRFNYTQNISDLVDEMSFYLQDRDKCYSILFGIQSLRYSGDEEIEYLNTLISELYEAAYGKSIETNIEIMARLYPEKLCEQIKFDDREEVSKMVFIERQKAYFNENNPYYMMPSTYTFERRIKVDEKILTIDEALELGILKDDNGQLVPIEDVEIYGGDKVILKDSIVSVGVEIENIEDYYNEQEHMKTR